MLEHTENVPAYQYFQASLLQWTSSNLSSTFLLFLFQGNMELMCCLFHSKDTVVSEVFFSHNPSSFVDT